MLNFAVGPVMMEVEILEIGSQQIPYFRTEKFSEMLLENEKILLECVGTIDQSRVIFLTASGTAAMEAAVMNVFTQKDKLLVINGGTFGKRFKQICDIHDLDSDEINLDYFESLTPGHLLPYDNKGYTGFLINALETSTGVLYDMNLVKDFCSRNNLLLVVDAISCFLADPFQMDDLGVDVTILSSQKAISLPPGMSYIVLNQKAQERIFANKVKSLYFNLRDYLDNGRRGQTPFTPAVSNLIQLNKRLSIIKSIGVESLIESVQQLATDFRKRIASFPFLIPSNRLSNALTPLQPSTDKSAFEIVKYLDKNFNIFVAPNGGELSSRIFRVGHIGALKTDDNHVFVNALSEMLKVGLL